MSKTYEQIIYELTDGGKRKVCDKAPNGWQCTRDYGHEGPCAAELLFRVCNPGKPNPYKDDCNV